MAIDASPSDAELVRSVLDGDRAAFGRLYDRYAAFVRAICYDTTRDAHEAGDLAQDVFLQAYRRLGDLRRPDRFAAWLTAIARSACRQWCRARTRKPDRPVDLDVAELPGPADEPGHNGLPQLHRALLALPEKERLAVQAFYLLGKSPEQARGVLNLSRSGFYRLLQRARARLKRLIGPDAEEV